MLPPSVINGLGRMFLVIAAHLVFVTLAQAQGPVAITFQGRVMYSTGVPAAGVTVTMTKTVNGASTTETTVADGGGNYVFESSRNPPPCNNVWGFSAVSSEIVDDEPLPPSATNSASGCVGPGTVTISDLIILRPRQITLGGIVRDQFGVPVQGLTVTMTRTKYDLVPNVVTTAQTTTDAGGHFQFGTYSRCSVVEEFKPSIGNFILPGGRSTSGCVLHDNDELGFPTLLGSLENAGATSCNANIGRPVNVTNGNVYLQQTDFHLPGVGDAIVITRTYNSISQNIGLFGRGWTTAYDERVVTNANNQLELTLPDGRLISFASPDFFGQIVKNADGSYAVTFKDGRLHRFNASGKLVSLRDRNGNQTSLTYDGTGRLTGISDAFNRLLSVTTNSSGRVLSISDSMGTIATYTYGGSNQLLTVTYVDNSSFQFSYVGFGSGLVLSAVTDGLGNIIEQHDYDSQGRATTSQAQGGIERYALNYVSATETDVMDALGHLTKYFFHRIQARKVVTRVEGLCSCGGSQVQTWNYDNQLNTTSQTDALGHITSYTYDGNGNRLTATDPTGTVAYSYNGFGEVLARTDQLQYVTTSDYDAQGNLLTTTDALNNATTFTYNLRGQTLTARDARGKVTTFTYDTSGNLTQRRDANNITTFFFYDARGRLTKVRDGLSRSTLFAYDLYGRLNRVTHPDNSFMTFTYDLAGRRTRVTDERGNPTVYVYDAAYRLTNVTDAVNQATSYAYDAMSNLTTVTDPLSRVTNYDYDDFNRLVKITFPPATSGAIRLFEAMAYDADGNVTSRTDTAGRLTSYAYDNVDRVTSTTDAANKTTSFQYDELSRIIALTDAVSQQYAFVYDALGRQTQTTRAGVSMTYAYDAVGNRTQRIDYNGVTTTYVYDNLNRLTTIVYPTRTATYSYDPLNNLTRATNENGSVYIGYDNRYRISSFSDPFFYGIGYNYDAVGNRTKLSVNGATYATYSYDAVNRLTALKDSANLTFNYTYDVANRLTSRTAPNGISSTYGYDGLDRLTSLMHTAGATVLSSNLYTYNNANNVSTWTTQTTQRGFTYDALDRLTVVSNFEMPAETYAYDAVGNRLASHLSAGYSYQPFNRLTSTATATYNYDNNGNMISRSDITGTQTFTYDEENRLTQVNLANGVTVTYKYDALGRRIQRTTTTGANERYVYDGHDVLIDLNADWSVATTYLNDLGIDNHLRQTNAATGVSYFLTDHLGSTSALTDAAGNLLESIAYDSFGNSAGNARTRYTYTGRERDPDTGMLYYRARFYDPRIGRFISEDPIGLKGGINQFAYVANKPLAFTDPTGLHEKDVHYWLTLFLARRTGCFSESVSALIAYYTQNVDDDPRTAPGPGFRQLLPGPLGYLSWAVPDYRQQQVNMDYHGLHPGSHQPYLDRFWIEATRGNGNFVQAGYYFHYLQDTFSHEGYDNPLYGHGLNGHSPDKTTTDVERTLRMAQTTWHELIRYGKAIGCECYPKWDDASSTQIRRFVEASGGPGSREINDAELEIKKRILGF